MDDNYLIRSSIPNANKRIEKNLFYRTSYPIPTVKPLHCLPVAPGSNPTAPKNFNLISHYCTRLSSAGLSDRPKHHNTTQSSQWFFVCVNRKDCPAIYALNTKDKGPWATRVCIFMGGCLHQPPLKMIFSSGCLCQLPPEIIFNGR